MVILIFYLSILFVMLFSSGLLGMGSLFLMCRSILSIDPLEIVSLWYGGLFRLLMGWCLIGKMFLIGIDSLLLGFFISNSLSFRHLSILKHTKYPFSHTLNYASPQEPPGSATIPLKLLFPWPPTTKNNNSPTSYFKEKEIK